MNSAHYEKMKDLFSRVHSRAKAEIAPKGAGTKEKWLWEFHDCLFACLMRYEALQVIETFQCSATATSALTSTLSECPVVAH